MPGAVVTSILEVEFVPGSGTWVDISDRVSDVTVIRPLAAVGEEQAPTTLSAKLKNYPSTAAGAGLGYCPFVPNSPTSRYYPNVMRDRRVRLTAVSGASTWVRFLGFVDRWIPSTSSGPADAVCQLLASDVLGRYARRQMLSQYGETALGDTRIDYWPFNDPTDSQSVRGRSGDPATWPARDGLVVNPSGPPGTLTLSGAEGGHLTDGQIDLTRGDQLYSPAPVILLQVRPGQVFGGFAAAFKLGADPAGGATGDDMVTGYDVNGQLLWTWSVALVAGKIQWELREGNTTARSFLVTDGPRDDTWHWWQIKFPTSTSSNIFIRDKAQAVRSFGSGAWTTFNPLTTAWVVVGGTMSPFRKGKQQNTFQGSISSFTMHHTTTVFDYSEFSVPAIPSDADRVSAFLDARGTAFDALVGGATRQTPDATQLMYTNNTPDLLSRWNEHARSTGGRITTRPDGRRRFLTAEGARPAAVALTVDAVEDLDLPSAEYQETQDERPTRVTVSGPVGQVSLINADAETQLGMTLEGSPVASAAGSLDVASSIAAMLLAGTRARLSQFAIDLGTTVTDKTAAAMALLVGDRVRVGNLPPEFAGLTYQDVFADGWSEFYTGDGKRAVFTFDTTPADDPAEAIADDAEYGVAAFGDGVATVTGGTCVGTTGTGTLIITSSSPASASGADYPVDLDWNGERITVTTPGGATSPQTFPVTVRGVAPTVARVHAAGEIVDAWHAATAGF